MNCETTQTFLHSYVDGELDLIRNLEIERHLQTCTTCAQGYANLQALRTAVRTDALYFQPPAALEKRLRAAVRKESKPRPAYVVPLRFATALAAVALVLWSLRVVLPVSTREPALAQEVLSSHVRALMANHLADVLSTDQHTVKPWFNGKLDFSPVVIDMADLDFPLVGGRLDYLDNRPVAALIYRHRKHFINLFIWPSPASSDAAAQAETRRGYHLVHWTQAAMTYWAVSDVNSDDLQEFVSALQNRMISSAQRKPVRQ